MMMTMKKDAVATKLEAKGQRRCHRGQSPKEKNLPKMQLIARRRPAIRHMLHSHGQKNFTHRSKTGFFVICANKCLFLERLTSAGILLSNNTTFLTAFNGQIFYQSSKYQAI